MSGEGGKKAPARVEEDKKWIHGGWRWRAGAVAERKSVPGLQCVGFERKRARQVKRALIEVVVGG